ncbi:MAG: UDP-N-acetylmuramoyl-L-alanine--D-glutamate ligase, partial [Odoribacter splanchnicus]
GICQVVDTHSLKDALAAARQYAVEGDTVLLSPCCASFDLFKNYENRGELFKAAVKEL